MIGKCAAESALQPNSRWNSPTRNAIGYLVGFLRTAGAREGRAVLKVLGWIVGIIFVIGLLVVFGLFDLIF